MMARHDPFEEFLNMNLVKLMTCVLTAALLSGCITENDHGICESNSDIMWTYTKEQGLIGTNRWCLHCNHTVEEADLPAYVGQYWPSAADQQASELTPCFYTYSTAEFNAELDGCRQNVCSESPNINDPVGRGHGAWRHSKGFLGWD